MVSVPNLKKIFIAGSTGSIGRAAVEVALSYPDKIKVNAISAGHYSEILLKQAIKLTPEYCFIPDKNEALNARIHFKKNSVNAAVFYEDKDLKEIIESDGIDIVLNSISGSSGLLASYYTLLAGKDIALANKESLVTAGDILIKLSKKTNSLASLKTHGILFFIFNAFLASRMKGNFCKSGSKNCRLPILVILMEFIKPFNLSG